MSNLKEKLMAAIEANTTYTLQEFEICHAAKLNLVRFRKKVLLTIISSNANCINTCLYSMAIACSLH